MSRGPTRRIVLAVFALLLGAGGIFAIVSYVQLAEKRAMAGQELADVFVVVEPIEAGTPATVIGDSVEVQQVPVAFRVDDAVTSLDALGDLATVAELVPGEQLLTSRFGPARARTVAGGTTAVPDGLLEVTIETSPERGVGAQVEPGEFVAVIATFDAFGDGGTAVDDPTLPGEPVPVADARTHFLLRKILVTNVQAQAPPQLQEDEVADRSRTPPSGTLLVTLAVEPAQVERLVFAGEFGTLWLARDEALAPEDATPIVSYANVFSGEMFVDTTEEDPVPDDRGQDGDEEVGADVTEQPAGSEAQASGDVEADSDTAPEAEAPSAPPDSLADTAPEEG